eukprot:scaffold4691_cov132-Skeletonema_menzelii.AAC.5
MMRVGKWAERWEKKYFGKERECKAALAFDLDTTSTFQSFSHTRSFRMSMLSALHEPKTCNMTCRRGPQNCIFQPTRMILSVPSTSLEHEQPTYSA